MTPPSGALIGDAVMRAIARTIRICEIHERREIPFDERCVDYAGILEFVVKRAQSESTDPAAAWPVAVVELVEREIAKLLTQANGDRQSANAFESGVGDFYEKDRAFIVAERNRKADEGFKRAAELESALHAGVTVVTDEMCARGLYFAHEHKLGLTGHDVEELLSAALRATGEVT